MRSNLLSLTFLSCILSLFSCSNKNLYDEGTETTTMSNPMQELSVTVPTGKIAVVTAGIDTLAVCSESTTIMAPNLDVTTISRSSTTSDITIEYLDNTNSNNQLQPKQQVFQVVAFEDSKSGDYDYNDLVFHSKVEHIGAGNGTESYLYFDPIALGSTKNIALGCVVKTANGNTWTQIIFDNVRNELFDGREGFINTLPGEALYKYVTPKRVKLPTTLKGYIKSVDWFIIVDNGIYLYAVSDNYKSSDSNGRPYGLIFSSINKKAYYNYVPGKKTECGSSWWDYPEETVNIDQVYPFSQVFSNTDKSNKFTVFSVQNGTLSEKYIKAIVVDANNEDKNNESLYSIDFKKHIDYKTYSE